MVPWPLHPPHVPSAFLSPLGGLFGLALLLPLLGLPCLRPSPGKFLPTHRDLSHMHHLVWKAFPKAPEWIPMPICPKHRAKGSEGVSVCVLNEWMDGIL